MLVASKTIQQTIADQGQDERVNRSAWPRWIGVLLGLAVVGWLWPHDPVGVPEQLSETRWIVGWLTVLVVVGALSGYVLKTTWSLMLAPLLLYLGGALHWFQFEWGFQQPHWPDFLAVSAVALAVLLITTGIPAGIACRVIAAESRPFGRGSGSIRLSAAGAGLLALLCVTALVVLPLPYLGGLLGFAAVLAGVAVLQEGRPTPTERLLSIAGIVMGSAITIIQIYMLWEIMIDLI
jgi:hypothetical protein